LRASQKKKNKQATANLQRNNTFEQKIHPPPQKKKQKKNNTVEEIATRIAAEKFGAKLQESNVERIDVLLWRSRKEKQVRGERKLCVSFLGMATVAGEVPAQAQVHATGCNCGGGEKRGM
jgi:hypothetical protein